MQSGRNAGFSFMTAPRNARTLRTTRCLRRLRAEEAMAQPRPGPPCRILSWNDSLARLSTGGSIVDKGGGMARVSAKRLLQAYEILRSNNGHLGWWPGNTTVEIIVGAILTQNTNWTNVESALRNLRRRGWLNLRSLRELPQHRLAGAIRPSGYFRQKAKKLKAFIAFLDETDGGSLRRMAAAPLQELRDQLLGVWGIGPETADSILLYAFRRNVFVVDTYTVRVMTRHGWAAAGADYEELRRIFEKKLPEDNGLYNDFHAQLVWVGKHFCKTRPRCEECPLRSLLPGGHPVVTAPRS
jgi:endonuclease-3 related protein